MKIHLTANKPGQTISQFAEETMTFFDSARRAPLTPGMREPWNIQDATVTFNNVTWDCDGGELLSASRIVAAYYEARIEMERPK